MDTGENLNECILISTAVQIGFDYGMIDGAYHKQWVIDQMLRILLGDEYTNNILDYNADSDYADWDVGIAP